MVLTLKQGAGKEEFRLLEAKLAQRMQQRQMKKGFDARKYKGTVRFDEDPLDIQKRLRNEWERDLS